MIGERIKGLNFYLDFKQIMVTTNNGEKFIGCPVAVAYADETASGEDELDIESNKIYSFRESEIEHIQIID